MTVNEASSSAAQVQTSGEPLVAVKSGEFSAQGPSDPGSKRDEPYKYYDGGASEASAGMRQAPLPPNVPSGAYKYAAPVDRRQIYEPGPRNMGQYEQRSGETTLHVNYKRDRAPDGKQVSRQTTNQAYISDGYAYSAH